MKGGIVGDRSSTENNTATLCTHCSLHIRAYLFEQHRERFHGGRTCEILTKMDFRQLLQCYPKISMSRVVEPRGTGCKTMRNNLKHNLFVNGGPFTNHFILSSSMMCGEDVNATILDLVRPDWIITVGLCLIEDVEEKNRIWKTIMCAKQNVAIFIPYYIELMTGLQNNLPTECILTKSGTWMVWVRS